MKNKKINILLVLVIFFVQACAVAPKENLYMNKEMKMKEYQIEKLPNGLIFITVPDDSLPRVSFAAALKIGTVQDPMGEEGLQFMTSQLLDQGTRSKSAVELAQTFNLLGTDFSASPGSESVSFSVSTLSTESESLWNEFYDVLRNPIFSQEEIVRLKDQIRTMLKKKKDNPASLAETEYEKIIFADSPYGRDGLGSEAALEVIDREKILGNYKKTYQPQNFIVVLAGRLSPSLKTHVKSSLEKWKNTQPPIAMWEGQLPSSRFEEIILTKSNLVQAQIRIGQRAVPRLDPDFIPLRLASEAFGGGFGARLMQRVRDDLGLTYGINSRTDGRKKIGAFTISTFTRTEKVTQTVSEVLNLFDQFSKKGITQEELDVAKSQILNQFPRGIETADGVAGQLMSTQVMGLPEDYLKNYPNLIQSMTLDQVNSAIKRNLAKDKLKVFIYGDDSLKRKQN